MKSKKIYLVLILMIITMAGVSYYYWYQNSNFISTEDARVDGNIVKVSSEVSGKIIDLPVEENQYIKQDDVIGRLSDVTLPASSNLDLTMVKSPIDGMILKKISHVGEMATPGSPMVMIANLNELYITANIEEDKLNKVKLGQYAEYTVDTFGGLKFHGKVIEIGSAANSVFSLLPQQSSGNSFTKVTQRVPVKISIDDYYGKKLLPGLNAVIKIHIKK